MRKIYNNIPASLKSILQKTNLYKESQIRNSIIVKLDEVNGYLDIAPPLLLRKELKNKPRVGIIINQGKSRVEGYVKHRASWLRYERFCKVNDIPYGIYDIERSNWLEEAEKYDVFVCHTDSNPSDQDMLESKLYVLENHLNKYCFPNFHELWQYENKNRSNYLYQIYNLPTIPTKLTYSYEEAVEIMHNIKFPFITKTSIGAGSTGVKKINSKSEALRYIKKIFSYRGLKSQYPYYRQKNYFYIQEFIDDATFDLRVMLVGNMAFGYYRYPNKGDFKASGSGNTEKKAIPEEALRLAIEVRNKLNSRQMGIDLLYSDKTNQYYIIETSLFNQIDTPEQLVIDGIPGYYDISNIDNIVFKEGKFWIQELVLRDVIEEWDEQHKY